ncbi:40S ribosomal protein S15-4 [Stylosanthes scabra]|nr:40S ribosomal protein S15-4 [Stylosanthes scabra]
MQLHEMNQLTKKSNFFLVNISSNKKLENYGPKAMLVSLMGLIIKAQMSALHKTLILVKETFTRIVLQNPSGRQSSWCWGVAIMADVEDVAAGSGQQQPKKRTFKKFSFRGVDLDALLDMSTDDLVKLFIARARRRFQRGLTRKPMALIKKLRKAKREAPAGEKPEPVRTHLRNMIIVPEMIGSIIGVYNGKTFNQVEIKPEMIGHYLAEFSISYKPVKHGRPGIGATHSSRFIPLK